jgi:protein-tyrosine phosphatase
MNQIKHYALWLGHAGDSRNFEQIFANGIRAVVQLAAEEQAVQFPRELISFRFPLVDGIGNDADLIQLAISSVETLITRGMPTLVCCGAGMSRSPAIAAAALAMIRQASLEDSLSYVTECHPSDVSPALWADVRRTSSPK